MTLRVKFTGVTQKYYWIPKKNFHFYLVDKYMFYIFVPTKQIKNGIMKLQATVELIKVGSVVEMSNGKVTATVTEETKHGWNLDYVYNGKIRKIQLSKSTLSNPHYMNDVFVIVDEEVALVEALREKGVPETDIKPIIKYMQAYCEGKEGIDAMSIRWNYHIEQYYKATEKLSK